MTLRGRAAVKSGLCTLELVNTVGKTIANMSNIVATVGEGEERELTEDGEKKRREENELRWATAAEGAPKEEKQREVSVEEENITEPALPSTMAVPTAKMPTEAQQRQHMLTHVLDPTRPPRQYHFLWNDKLSLFGKKEHSFL